MSCRYQKTPCYVTLSISTCTFSPGNDIFLDAVREGTGKSNSGRCTAWFVGLSQRWVNAAHITLWAS